MLHIHRAERADGLAHALATILLEPLEDPLAPELVAVPTRGMERWLTQRMSSHLGASPGRRDGVCANIQFPFPGRLVTTALAAATGLDPETDPWQPERSVWPLMQVVDEQLAQPWLTDLARHLGATDADAEAPRRDRRFSVVRHIADLYDHYGVRRPEMVLAWARGEDTDGAGGPLDRAGRWQAQLWRELRARIDRPSRAEQLRAASARLRDQPELIDLPARVSVFGLTRLPATYLQVLSALAAGRDVHLFLLHPSPALWRAVTEVSRLSRGIISRGQDPTAALPSNRLLASWGQDSRELQLVVGAGGEQIDHHHPVEHYAGTLLGRIQADIRNDRSPSGPPLPGNRDERPTLAPDDNSLQVHACHGRARQVEVARDAILHLLAQDSGLEPRDVIVMCPDIEVFAPLIQATFGAGEVYEQDDPDAIPVDARPVDLRVRLADRSLRQANAVLAVLAQLLELAGQRVTASQLLDLAGREPVRRRFGFDDEELARMQDWVKASGIHWGLDAAHREPFKLEALDAGTWRAGLNRIMLGVAMSEEDQRLFTGVLPLDDVESSAIDLAGRFAEFVDRVESALDALSGAKTIGAWANALSDASFALTLTSERESWQRSQLLRLLADVVEEASASGTSGQVSIALPELRALLADRLRGRPTRANFRTGHLTICTLVPMRSVPHRVICVLGLDDGEFPRKTPRDGDDLILADPHVGDRDPRSEDRQMLLDALLAAEDHLIITYTGNDERTNIPRPPAVPVAELLDVVDDTVRAQTGPARTQVVVRHPLQPFDRRNFSPGGVVSGSAWSFDRVALEGARALSAHREARPRFLPSPLPDDPAPVLELENLVAFAERPVRTFLRRRLGVAVGDFNNDIQDSLPVQLDGLAGWGVGQRMLEGLLSGAEMRASVQAEIARGTLPPGRLGIPVVRRLSPLVQRLADAASALGEGPRSLEVNLTLSDGRAVSGAVAGVCDNLLRAVTFSRIRAGHRLAAWVRLLALTAAHPEEPFEAATVGRARQGAGVAVIRIPPLAADAGGRRELALAHLDSFVDVYDRGMREPLPLPCATSAAYAEARRAGGDGHSAARDAWESGFRRYGEDALPEHQLVYGGVRGINALLAPAPRSDEHGDGWETSETTRFGRLSRRLWDPLLALELVSER
jgi:exodeoxyribonuclease V gamma subunit